MKPPIERIFTVVSRIIREQRLKPHTAPIGKLLDALAADKEYDDVHIWLCQRMHASDRLTRSAFICAAFEFLGLQAVAAVAMQAHEQFKAGESTLTARAKPAKKRVKKAKRRSSFRH